MRGPFRERGGSPLTRRCAPTSPTRGEVAGLAPGARFAIHRPQEAGRPPEALDAYDGVFLTGSPLHVYHDNHAVRANVDFMRAVFDAGVPSFGSCAGLHIAVAAAGGTVRRKPDGHEVGLARPDLSRGDGHRVEA